MSMADNWLYDFEEAKKLALATNKLILVDFWATWCGPCKKMDRESWSKDDVKLLMSGYVPVKIDIDSNRELASRYNIRSIPYVFVLDGNGKVVHQTMSYKSKSELVDLLKTYALSTEFLSNELISYYKKQSFVSAYRIASKYHDYSLYLDEDLRKDFLKASDDYFEEALDYLDEEDFKKKAAFRQKIELYDIQKELLLNNARRAMKLLKKIDKVDVDKMNNRFFAFLNYATYKLMNNKDQTKLWEGEVTEADKQKVKLLMKTA